jgi:septum site-determining protein MinC
MDEEKLTVTSDSGQSPEAENPDNLPEEKEAELLAPQQSLAEQVRFKTVNRQLYLILPNDRASDDPDTPARPWSDVLTQLEQRLLGTEKFWTPQTPVYLQALDRLLDVPQLQEIHSALAAYNLRLVQVITKRRQTAINAVTAGFFG